MKGTVLIVDDSLTVRMDLAQAFEADGFGVLPCGTGAEARSLAAQGAVSAAILDVLLPDVDGVQLLAELRSRAQKPDLPILMLSTEVEVQDRLRGLKKGADDYIGKPYDPGYVVARVNELLRSRQSAEEKGATPPTILVVDDSATFREQLREELERAGYAVQCAASGEEGLRLLALLRPLALIVDGLMPDLDGAGVIRRVRLDAALRGTPCLLLTASEEGQAELSALEAGADAFVRKGEDTGLILARLRALLRHVRAEPLEGRPLLGFKRVLLVDDSETYLQETARLLRGEGYDVVLARSGEQALDVLGVQPVDCILLDLMMPGLGGRNTCRHIKGSALVRDVPLIMVTSVEDREAMIDGLSLGADDYITKSSEFAVLEARLRAQIRRKQFEDEHRRVQDELLASERRASEARAARQVAEAKAAHAEELDRKNKELEAFSAPPELPVSADRRLLQVVLENLLGNAWKFTSKTSEARVEVGVEAGPRGNTYFVRDNGAGFDMAYAERLFNPFQRLHTEQEFAGTGIGLATVQRVIERHGGRVWAHGAIGQGATLYFTLPVPGA